MDEGPLVLEALDEWYMNPVISGKYIYVLTKDGHLYAMAETPSR
jgi:hypothetical protein